MENENKKTYSLTVKLPEEYREIVNQICESNGIENKTKLIQILIDQLKDGKQIKEIKLKENKSYLLLKCQKCGLNFRPLCPKCKKNDGIIVREITIEF